MPYRDEPRPIATTHDPIARALGILARCAFVFPAAAVVFALSPEPLFSSGPLATAVTWIMRAGFVALGLAGVLLSRSAEGRARTVTLAGGIVVTVWAVASTVLQTLARDALLKNESLETFLVLNAISSALGDAGILLLIYAVSQARHARGHDPGLALRAAVAAIGGTLLQSLVWATRARGAHGHDPWSDDISVMQLFFRFDNLFWAAPFLLLGIGALQRRRPRSIAPLETKVDDDVLPSSRTASREEAMAMFGIARALVAAAAVAAIAIGLPSLVLIVATVLSSRTVSVAAAARTVLFPHGALLTALGMAFYATRGPDAREASSGPRSFLLIAMLGVALSDLLYYAGGSLGIPRSFDADSLYAAWAFTAAVSSVALSVVIADVHRRARVAIVRRSDSDEIPSFAKGTDDVMRTASVAGGVAAMSTACGQCATTRSSTTALWVIAAIAALAATIAAATAARRARRLADRLEAFRL